MCCFSLLIFRQKCVLVRLVPNAKCQQSVLSPSTHYLARAVCASQHTIQPPVVLAEVWSCLSQTSYYFPVLCRSVYSCATAVRSRRITSSSEVESQGNPPAFCSVTRQMAGVQINLSRRAMEV